VSRQDVIAATGVPAHSPGFIRFGSMRCARASRSLGYFRSGWFGNSSTWR